MSILRLQTLGILVTAFSLCGCAVQSAATFKVKPILKQECVDHCTTLGMELGAVVLMMEHAGCVCCPKKTQKEVAEAGGATLGGNITIAATQAAAAAAAAQQQQEQQRQRQQQQHRY
jgi:lipid-binding SYLF domain-containing protein